MRSFPHVSEGSWDASVLNTTNFPSGLEGSGPVVFYTSEDGAAVVSSAFSSFMATSSELRGLAPDDANHSHVNERQQLTLAYGLTGTFPTIPQGFTYSVVLSHTSGSPGAGLGGGWVAGGIQDNVRNWGDKMQRVHLPQPRVDDYINTHLGYDTDNGASVFALCVWMRVWMPVCLRLACVYVCVSSVRRNSKLCGVACHFRVNAKAAAAVAAAVAADCFCFCFRFCCACCCCAALLRLWRPQGGAG